MRLLACSAVALGACRKSTPPTPAIIETSAPLAATAAPSASVVAPATASAIAVEDAAPVVAEESDAQAPWVTAKSTGCLGWNPTTRHAICITGSFTTDTTSSVVARDLFDGQTPQIDWLDPKSQGSISGYSPYVDLRPLAESVEKVAKLVAKMNLKPIDKTTARTLGINQEIALSVPNKIKIRYERTTSGGETTDQLEVVCGTTTNPWLVGGRAHWATKDAPKESGAEVYVDPAATMALVVWESHMARGLLWSHFFFAGGVDLTAPDSCQY